MTSKEIALEKIKNETKSSIEKIKLLCTKLTYGELAYCIYYLHVIRILKHRELESLTNMSVDRFNDVLKHSISCIFKYSNISKILKDDYSVNANYSILITKVVNHLHNLHENSSLLTVIDEIEVEGERNQYLKLDFSKIIVHQDKRKTIEYSTRFQKSITKEKEKPIPHSIYLEKFAEKYSQYDLISKDIFGLEIKEITDKLNSLLSICIDNIMKNEINMTFLENGNIDLHDIETLKQTVKSFIFNEKIIFEIFGKKGMKFIRELTFKKSEFKSHELNYHYILRSPLLKIKNEYIVVPELLLDSLFSNFHYTLLENKQYSEKHKKIMSDIFVNEILDIGKKYGFVHFASELELYQGKNKLGDIDLILRHENLDFDILIEAKNHTVPLPVYHGVYEEINKRLEELKKSWKNKVDRRYKHLLDNCEKYNIKKKFKYLIVSRYPEILSHHSEYLVLSTSEFDFYLQNNTNFSNFSDLFNELYKQETWSEQDTVAFMEETLNLKTF
jgi:hypothetical protein